MTLAPTSYTPNDAFIFLHYIPKKHNSVLTPINARNSIKEISYIVHHFIGSIVMDTKMTVSA